MESITLSVKFDRPLFLKACATSFGTVSIGQFFIFLKSTRGFCSLHSTSILKFQRQLIAHWIGELHSKLCMQYQRKNQFRLDFVYLKRFVGFWPIEFLATTVYYNINVCVCVCLWANVYEQMFELRLMVLHVKQ